MPLEGTSMFVGISSRHGKRLYAVQFVEGESRPKFVEGPFSSNKREALQEARRLQTQTVTRRYYVRVLILGDLIAI